VAILKFLTTELAASSPTSIHEGKEWIASAGDILNAVKQAHVIKARSLNCNRPRSTVIRAVGQQVAQSWIDVEETSSPKRAKPSLAKNSRALRFAQNRLIFLDGGKTTPISSNTTCCSAINARDPDRFEAMDALFRSC